MWQLVKYWTPDNPTNDYCRLNAAGPNTGLANGVDKVTTVVSFVWMT